jgi:hypothetical protein
VKFSLCSGGTIVAQQGRGGVGRYSRNSRIVGRNDSPASGATAVQHVIGGGKTRTSYVLPVVDLKANPFLEDTNSAKP